MKYYKVTLTVEVIAFVQAENADDAQTLAETAAYYDVDGIATEGAEVTDVDIKIISNPCNGDFYLKQLLPGDPNYEDEFDGIVSKQVFVDGKEQE